MSRLLEDSILKCNSCGIEFTLEVLTRGPRDTTKKEHIHCPFQLTPECKYVDIVEVNPRIR